jgi:hypothetical protein
MLIIQKRILFYSIFYKIIIFFLAFISDYLIKDYDKSTDLILSEGDVNKFSYQLLKHTARWDSHFFLEIA